MTKVKEFLSRYREPRYFQEIKDGYLVWGESPWMRTIGGEDGVDVIHAIDFEGGPFISCEEDLKESFNLKGKVKNIEPFINKDKNNCYKLLTK